VKSGRWITSGESNLLPSRSGKKFRQCIILLEVLYECDVWSVILTEERRLRVVENRVLRKIFGPKGNEVTGEWRLHNEELNDLYCSTMIIWVMKLRRMRWAGQVACMWEKRDYTGFWWGTTRKEITWKIQA
jgi:hypothetical protein